MGINSQTFFAPEALMIERLKLFMNGPSGSPTGWVRRVEGMFDLAAAKEQRQFSPAIYVVALDAQTISDESHAQGLNALFKQRYSVIVTASRANVRGSCVGSPVLWALSPVVTRVIELLHGWYPSPSNVAYVANSPRSDGQQTMGEGTGNLQCERVQYLPEETGFALVNLTFGVLWALCDPNPYLKPVC